jgi:UDP-N-acetylmuramate dehydrogenase
MVISTQGLQEIIWEGSYVRASAGIPLPLLLDRANRLGNRSLNFLAGIPGTLGGAIAMNAGIPERSIADVLEEIAILREDYKIRNVSPEMCRFGYRRSQVLEQRIPVLWARLRLNGKPYDRFELISRKRATQPLDLPSAGCVFKNPPEGSAGYLIEKAGLKGLIIGKAKVSEKHANFIVNLGGATNAEIRKLIDIVRQKVYKSFHIWLELEIEVGTGCERGNRERGISSGLL